MSEAEVKTAGRRGRPAIPKEDKKGNTFHLVLMNEEMEVIRAAAKLDQSASAAAFIRRALNIFDQNEGIKKSIPKGLLPSEEDSTTKHFPVLLSDADREIVSRVQGGRNHSLFIRTATLAVAFHNKLRDANFDAAVAALKAKKGA